MRCAHPKPIARKPSGASRATDTPRRSHARSPRGARRTPEGRAQASSPADSEAVASARCTAPGTVLPPLLPPRPTRRAPKRRRFMASRVESFTRAPDKTAPLTVSAPLTAAGVTAGVRRTCPTAAGSPRASIGCVDGTKTRVPSPHRVSCRIRRNVSIARAGSGFFLDAPRADPANAR